MAASPLSILTLALPQATSSTAYSTTLASAGGAGSETWSVSSGALPPGITLAPSTGVISGTTTTSGSYPFTVQVTDSSTPNPQTATQNLTLNVTS